MAAWRYEISLLVMKNISLVRFGHSRNIFQHSKRNFVSPSGHVISSMYAHVYQCTAMYMYVHLHSCISMYIHVQPCTAMLIFHMARFPLFFEGDYIE